MRLLLLALAGTCLTVAAPADDRTACWPQWRGPNRDGTISERTWPTDFRNLRERWRVPLGPSYSGPIISAGRVFTTETVDKQREVVRAFDQQTGRQLWQTEWEGALRVPFFARRNGDWIRSTPAVDGDALYVGGIRDVLVCLDTSTGAVRWRVDFTERYGTDVPSFGFVCSPLIVGEHLYVQAGGGFCKLDKRTGASLWRVLDDGGGMLGSAFSSPVPATIHGRPQLVVQTRLTLCGIDPDSGATLWSHDVPAFRGMNILTPLVYDNGVFTSTHRNKSFFYRVTRSGDDFDCELAWESKPQGYMSSPVLRGQHAYLPLGNGRLSCIDLASGQEAWRSSAFGPYWSMILNGSRLLALDAKGELILVEADPHEFRLLARKRITSDETWAHLAICGNQLFVRELEALVAYEWK